MKRYCYTIRAIGVGDKKRTFRYYSNEAKRKRALKNFLRKSKYCHLKNAVVIGKFDRENISAYGSIITRGIRW